jgi:hypothetical protein
MSLTPPVRTIGDGDGTGVSAGAHVPRSTFYGDGIGSGIFEGSGGLDGTGYGNGRIPSHNGRGRGEGVGYGIARSLKEKGNT